MNSSCKEEVMLSKPKSIDAPSPDFSIYNFFNRSTLANLIFTELEQPTSCPNFNVIAPSPSEQLPNDSLKEILSLSFLDQTAPKTNVNSPSDYKKLPLLKNLLTIRKKTPKLDLTSKLPKIKGDLIIWPAAARIHFNDLRISKLSPYSWNNIVKFYNSKFETNLSSVDLQRPATHKRAFNLLNGTLKSHSKSAKSLRESLWNLKVSNSLKKIRLSRNDIEIENSCHTRRFMISTTDFKTLEMIDCEIKKINISDL
ncbi:MAG: hypothetical protein MHPSP_003622 [Paramarteilia canceri]